MRIGITMRQISNDTYPERRDALSDDWGIFIKKIFPQATLVPLLNDPTRVVKVIKDLDLQAIILSGGNDWGAAPDRDATEKKLISYCVGQKIPLIGVCRGMQVLNMVFGGKLEENVKKTTGVNHVNIKHTVHIMDNPFFVSKQGKDIVVNSFHNQGILRDDMSKQLKVFALSGDIVEGLFCPGKPIVGVQWHPERKGSDFEFDKRLLKNLFSN